jgi:hypothetical protein
MDDEVVESSLPRKVRIDMKRIEIPGSLRIAHQVIWFARRRYKLRHH